MIEEIKQEIANGILDVLKESEEIPRADLIKIVAKRLKKSISTVNTVLRELEKKGIIESRNFAEGKYIKYIRLKDAPQQEEEQEQEEKDSQEEMQETIQETTLEDVVFTLLNKLGFSSNYLTAIKEGTKQKLSEVVYEAVKEWGVSRGFNPDGMLTVYGIPLIPSSDVIEIKDDKTSKSIIPDRKFKIKGFKEDFELFFKFAPSRFKDLKKACELARVIWNTKNRKCVIIFDIRKKEYVLMVESYDFMKDIEIGLWRSRSSEIR